MNGLIAVALGMIVGFLITITYLLIKIRDMLEIRLWNIQEDTRTTNWILKENEE